VFSVQCCAVRVRMMLLPPLALITVCVCVCVYVLSGRFLLCSYVGSNFLPVLSALRTFVETPEAADVVLV
jgi:hypothetical protein